LKENCGKFELVSNVSAKLVVSLNLFRSFQPNFFKNSVFKYLLGILNIITSHIADFFVVVHTNLLSQIRAASESDQPVKLEISVM